MLVEKSQSFQASSFSSFSSSAVKKFSLSDCITFSHLAFLSGLLFGTTPCLNRRHHLSSCQEKALIFYLLNLTASLMAEIILLGEAISFPAISKAQPWSGDVLMKLSPRVRFTAVSKASIFSGINPWS